MRRLAQGLENKAHVFFIDFLIFSFFTFVELLRDLLERGVYVIHMVHSNIIGVPKSQLNKKMWERQPQGTLGWLMHDSQCMACVVCVNKTKVLLIVHTWVSGTTTPPAPQWLCLGGEGWRG